MRNQWLHFWQVAVSEVKFPHVENISTGITADAGKFLTRVCCKLLGVGLPLNNKIADVPIKHDHFLVGRFEGFVLG